MSSPCKCPVGSTRWTLVENTTMKTYLKKVPVTSVDNNRIFISCYWWFHSFRCIVKTLVYNRVFEGSISILDNVTQRFSCTVRSLITLKILHWSLVLKLTELSFGVLDSYCTSDKTIIT